MEVVLQEREIRNQKRGRQAAGIALVALILLLFIPIFFFQNPPPGQEGILVNLGLPDVGQGDENAGPAPAETVEEIPTPPSEPESQPDPVPEPEVEETPPPKVDPQPVEKPVVTTEDPNAVALRKKKEQEAREKSKRDQEAREKAQREAREKAQREAKERADREARERAAREAANTKSEIGGLFGSGKGKGNTGKPGNQGDPNGDPNASNLEGISTGAGRVGGGLGSRGLLSSPSVTENSQKAGTVVVEVCVDSDGKIIPSSVRYTQRGSTTSDAQLKAAAINNAKRWRFSKGTIDKQCGTITYNFKVR